MKHEQLEKYFRRIGYDGYIVNPTLDALTILQEKHSQTFPFENLNPLFDIPVKLDIESLYSKLVIKGRGGYCYEQNILFMHILRSLGYNVRGITGRVFNGGSMIKKRTHMLLLISINGVNYISDVGFGSLASIKPLLLKEDEEQKVNHDIYRIIKIDDGFILQIKLKNDWCSLYLFDLQTQYSEDFEVGNWYTSTHPISNFRHNLMLSIKGIDVRYSLDNNIFATYYLVNP